MNESSLLAGLVDDPGARPRDEVPLAGSAVPRVFVLLPGHVGREGVAHGLYVVGRREDLPERPPVYPLVVGAGPLTDDLDTARELEDEGASAVVLRSMFEEEIAG